MAAAAVAIPAALQVYGTILSAKGAKAQGAAERKAAEFQADQLDAQAGQEQAASQRVSADQQRVAKYAESRAQALAAASGGGASDKTVTDVIGKIAQEGAYRSALSLYQGDSEARQMRLRATGARYTGKATESAYDTRSLGTLISGAGSLFAKYGRNVPTGGGGSSSLAAGSATDPNDYYNG